MKLRAGDEVSLLLHGQFVVHCLHYVVACRAREIISVVSMVNAGDSNRMI